MQLECLTWHCAAARGRTSHPGDGYALRRAYLALALRRHAIGENINPALALTEDWRPKTSLQEKVSASWLVAAERVDVDTETRMAKEKRIHHSPEVVTPIAVSAGGGIFPWTDCTAVRS